MATAKSGKSPTTSSSDKQLMQELKDFGVDFKTINEKSRPLLTKLLEVLKQEKLLGGVSRAAVNAPKFEGMSSFAADMVYALQQELFGGTMFQSSEQLLKELENRRKVLEFDTTLESVARKIKRGEIKKIVVITGAGISVSAGIPDFRSPKTGLYANLQKYNLPYAEAIFDVEYFSKTPQPFYTLAKELYPGKYKPTLTHYFIKLLNEKGVLLRNYTQNIDTLERQAGIKGDVVIECHGSFASAHCLDKTCWTPHDPEDVKKTISEGGIPRCTKCNELVKPDIVFFGESLPEAYFKNHTEDLKSCDLVLIMGTSLNVAPVSNLPLDAGRYTPQVLLNMDAVGSFYREDPENFRYVFRRGPCDESVYEFAKLLGWDNDLLKLAGRKRDPLEKELRKMRKECMERWEQAEKEREKERMEMEKKEKAENEARKKKEQERKMKKAAKKAAAAEGAVKDSSDSDNVTDSGDSVSTSPVSSPETARNEIQLNKDTDQPKMEVGASLGESGTAEPKTADTVKAETRDSKAIEITTVPLSVKKSPSISALKKPGMSPTLPKKSVVVNSSQNIVYESQKNLELDITSLIPSKPSTPNASVLGDTQKLPSITAHKSPPMSKKAVGSAKTPPRKSITPGKLGSAKSAEKLKQSPSSRSSAVTRKVSAPSMLTPSVTPVAKNVTSAVPVTDRLKGALSIGSALIRKK
eukprot:Colp12_sorted_trinity150504_noHs@29914